MTNKNYVKKFKGLDVPEGATHFNESNMLYPRAFHDAANGRMFKVGDGWWKVAKGSIPATAVELPVIPQINWDEQPSKDAVWVVDNDGIHASTWHSDSKDGGYKEVNSKNSWSKEAEGRGRITVYRREDCVVDSPEDNNKQKTIFWVAKFDKYGTPWNEDGPHSNASEAEKSKILLEGMNKNENYIVTSTTFSPLKTKHEKDREAFIDGVASLFGESDDMDIYGLASVMFDLGFTAPKGEGGE